MLDITIYQIQWAVAGLVLLGLLVYRAQKIFSNMLANPDGGSRSVIYKK